MVFARPSDDLPLVAFIGSGLPMIYDSENSITIRVADLLHTHIFENISKWYQKGMVLNEKSSTAWKLAINIGRMEKESIFKAAIGTMIKQGMVRNDEKNKFSQASSIQHTMDVLKAACSYRHQCLLSGDTSYGLVPAHISDAVWIILEALVSQENLNVLSFDSKQSTSHIALRTILQSSSSVHFIVEYYQKHGEVWKHLII